MTKTAQDYRNEAREAYARQQESWERSDTDGFLSQWASGLTAQLADTRAAILEHDGTYDFTGLYEGDRRVLARLITTQYGTCWLLHESETALIDRRGKPFIPCGRRSRIQRDLGLSERAEIAPAWAAITGEGTGLSGNAWVEVYRSGDKWGSDATIRGK